MERIKIALEKARAERDQNVQVPAAVRQVVGTPGIEYTQTRSISVSSEILRGNRIITELNQGAYVDAIKILRTKVLMILRENQWNSILVTSCSENEGKSLTAINLAISLALEIDQTVMLVDANLRDPSVHKFFGLPVSRGLTDYLLDGVPISELLVNPLGINRFVILPGGRPLMDSSEMLSSPRMVELVRELKSRYDSRIIIFDLPHLGVADVLAFSPFTDASILVLEEGTTTRNGLEKATEMLKQTRLIGTVLNKSRENSG